MRVAVTGAGGMLGQAVVAAARERGHDVAALTRGELDVADEAAVRAAFARVTPEAIINCAAWTDVDGAEGDEAAATEINGTGAGNVSRVGAEVGAHVVHVSSDYVFSGEGTEPYVESDDVAPRSAYGRSKLAGERAVAEGSADHAIVRTAWLFGAGGRNFVDTMLTLGAERDELRVVDDQVGCPTWTGHLAPALVELAESPAGGVFHVASAGRCSWFELARAAIDQAGLDCAVHPTTTDEFPRPAPRPAFSVLATERPGETPRLPTWQEGLTAYLAERAARTEVTR